MKKKNNVPTCYEFDSDDDNDNEEQPIGYECLICGHSQAEPGICGNCGLDETEPYN